MDSKTLKIQADKILIGLVDFFYEGGYKSDAYNDPINGGIYENKLESRIGLQTGDKSPSPEFILAAKTLESNGYVRRIQRDINSQLMGIWPTQKGLDRYDYLKAGLFKKLIIVFKENWKSVLISTITTIIGLALARLFKLFG